MIYYKKSPRPSSSLSCSMGLPIKATSTTIILLVVWCDPDGTIEKVHTRMHYFSVSRPQSVTADGLFQVLEEGFLASRKCQQMSARSL